MEYVESRSCGLKVTLIKDANVFAVKVVSLKLNLLHVVSHKGQFWVRCCSYYTLMTCQMQLTNLTLFFLQMTPMSFSLINQSSLCYLLPTLNLSMWRNGLGLINFLLTWEKLIMSFFDLIGNPSPLLCQVNSSKFLVVYIDQHLTWND